MPAAVLLLAIATACGGSDVATTTAGPATTDAPTTTAAATNPGAVAGEGDVVSVHYVGTLDDGEQFDSSRDGGTPLTFTVGSGQMIPGFDQAVRGMAVGDLKSVRIAAGDAYGERDDALLIEVGIDQVPEGAQVGDQLSTSDGQTVVVAEIDGDAVLIDANHPLAGQALTFEIELLSIG